MKVIGVLNNFKDTMNSSQSQKNVSSLPNIAPVADEYVFPHIVNEKRPFWEKMSCRSMDNKLIQIKADIEKENVRIKRFSPDDPLIKHRSVNDLNSTMLSKVESPTENNFSASCSDIHRSSSMSVREKKSFWEQKSYETLSRKSTSASTSNLINTRDNESDLRILEISPSCNDIEFDGVCRFKEDTSTVKTTSVRKYKSMEDSLDNYYIMSIDERKKMLEHQGVFKRNRINHGNMTEMTDWSKTGNIVGT